MKNQLVAATLERVADLMEIDAVDYRTKAYRRAAHTVETLSEDIEELKNEGRLQELPGVGIARLFAEPHLAPLVRGPR